MTNTRSAKVFTPVKASTRQKFTFDRLGSEASLKKANVSRFCNNSYAHPMENNSGVTSDKKKYQTDSKAFNRLTHKCNMVTKEIVNLPAEGFKANAVRNMYSRHSFSHPQNVHESRECDNHIDEDYMPKVITVNRVMYDSEVAPFQA